MFRLRWSGDVWFVDPARQSLLDAAKDCEVLGCRRL